MREWLSWWSATLPRSRPRVRVPSRARQKRTSDRMSFFVEHLKSRRDDLSGAPKVRVTIPCVSPVSRSKSKPCYNQDMKSEKKPSIDEGYLKKRICFIIATLMLIPVTVILGFDRVFSVQGFVFFAILVGAFLTSLGFVIAFVVMIKTEEDHTGTVLPITSISVAIISTIIGVPLYIKGRHEILGEMAPLLLWIFVSVPAAVTAFIQFVVFKLRNRRKDSWSSHKNGAAPAHIQRRSTPCIEIIVFLLRKIKYFPDCRVDNIFVMWYIIDESKPLPILARGCSHFLYLKTVTSISLDIRIISTEDGKPLRSLHSTIFFTSLTLISIFPKLRIIPPGLSLIWCSPFLTALSTA